MAWSHFIKILLFVFTLSSIGACAQGSQESISVEIHSEKEGKGRDTAYFAAGCFWCVEAIFESIQGVDEVISGYAGGMTKNPTYEEVCTGKTGHAETIMIIYNSKIVLYDTLLSAFFNSHDPSTLNSQGPDFGTQYRSAIFYSNEEEKLKTENFIDSLLNKKIFPKITTEIKPLEKFWVAEIYHQDFEKNNPENPYIERISVPRLNRFKENFKGRLKE
jgi:peptide-methionine (S)-S-oxide reductase